MLFASIVDDPSSRPEEFPTEAAQETERQRLFRIIERLVLWENTNNEIVLNEARREILKATDGHPPPVLDPFCGGGSIPLEAQRLGLEAHGSDLNPVAVLITKALIEIPPKFAGMPPVNPESRKQKKLGDRWPGASGLAEDVRYYGKWMRDEAEKRIGHLYPRAKLLDGSDATVIAWLWARTVKCPNPACGTMMPLASKFWLSTKKGKEAWVEPLIDNSSDDRIIKFEVKTGQGMPPEGTVNRRGARCIACGTPVGFDYIRAEWRAKRMESQLMAIVGEGKKGRTYLQPISSNDETSISAKLQNVPDTDLPKQALGFRVQIYGMTKHRDLFTYRQLIALSTFSSLVKDAKEHAYNDAIRAKMASDDTALADGGLGSRAYSDAIASYLAFAVDKMVDTNTILCTWQVDPPRLRATFGRQALQMTWDYAEANIFGDAAGDFQRCFGSICEILDRQNPVANGFAAQLDAGLTIKDISLSCPIISTDPPYYDNIGYADLSDIFYIWLRSSIGSLYPALFSTLLTPKAKELIASPFRFEGSNEHAQKFFEKGLIDAFGHINKSQNKEYPLTIYYAYKQVEDDGIEIGVASTGWEVMLDILMKTGYAITGTWPLHTELNTRNRSRSSNALASSIVLVCRPRPEDAPVATRREFLSALKRELPEALRQLQKGNIAPVDLAQAAIGPGMSIFSRYSKVLEADGEPMRVRTALQLINVHLDEYLSEQEGEYDADTRWALSWFEQYGMTEGPFGDAETLSKAKNTSVSGMIQAGILKAGAGRARLLKREEMDASWSPESDSRLTVWEATQYLILALESRGEAGAAVLLQKLGGHAQNARDLAYRLYSICERKSWSQEALAYNSLVMVWPRLSELSREKEAQRGLDSFQ